MYLNLSTRRIYCIVNALNFHILLCVYCLQGSIRLWITDLIKLSFIDNSVNWIIVFRIVLLANSEQINDLIIRIRYIVDALNFHIALCVDYYAEAYSYLMLLL